MRVDHSVETTLSKSIRVEQVSSMFDVPAAEKSRLEWHGDLPLEQKPWQVGLIVGPSGCGKTVLLRKLFGDPAEYEWKAASVIDDFPRTHKLDAVSDICQAVGFNTIPAWLRPFAVLSNGEKFRVELARRLLEATPAAPILCDEFTSVVDRQVAHIGAHAVQKYVRRHAGLRFIAATCHYDLEEWLQPDWILEPATMTFRWRAVQRRPALKCEIHRVGPDAWDTFSRYHYLTAELHRAARCFLLRCEGQPASFAAVLYRPHPKAQDIWGFTRGVTLPDFQGLGLIYALMDRVAGAFKALDQRMHLYPAHPAFIRASERSPSWRMTKRPGLAPPSGRLSTLPKSIGGRQCAVFEYCGPAAFENANALIPDLVSRLRS